MPNFWGFFPLFFSPLILFAGFAEDHGGAFPSNIYISECLLALRNSKSFWEGIFLWKRQQKCLQL